MLPIVADRAARGGMATFWLLSGSVPACEDRAVSIVASTALGRLEGSELGGVLVFRGVPYAEPPVGALRFRAPAPPKAWTGLRSARNAGPTAPQVIGLMRDLLPQDEDCLYLNVWTPALDARARPVFVLVHGGAFVSGASTHVMYDGRELARRGDVVVVSFNYRLGALGFADIAALAEGGFSADANIGLHDQLAALRWVQQHIAAFGGDPQQVTLIGQSAGAMTVCTLLGLPAAHGLFSRAIAQSGAAHHVELREESARIAKCLLDALAIGPSELHRLRELPYEAITQAQLACLRQWVQCGARTKPLRSANTTLMPTVDGELIAELPLEAAARGAGGDIPLLLGTTRDEYHFWVFLTDPEKRNMDDAGLLRVLEKRLPRVAEQAAAVYRRHLPQGAMPWQIFSASETDRVFTVPALRLCEARARAAAPTFMYRFDWVGPLFEGRLGACHGIEFPFVFGLIGETFGKVFAGDTPEARTLSERTLESWLAFARTGDPSTEVLGRWPRVSREPPLALPFAGGAPRPVEPAIAPALRAFWSDQL